MWCYMENGDGRESRCPCRRVGKSTIVAKGQPASNQIRQFIHMSSCCEGVSGSAILCKSADCFTAAATTSRRATLSQFSLTDSTCVTCRPLVHTVVFSAAAEFKVKVKAKATAAFETSFVDIGSKWSALLLLYRPGMHRATTTSRHCSIA